MIKMRRGYYMHTDAMDCFIEILRIQWQDNKRVKARVRWWNLGFTGQPWVIRENDPLEISADQIGNWKHINPLTHRVSR